MSRDRIVLGVHLGHDRGAALVRNGVLWYAIAQERVDRLKHSPSPEIPRQAIEALVGVTGIRLNDIDAVGISYTNVSIDSIIDQIATEFRDLYDVEGMPIFGVSHHICHALAAFHTSGFQDADVFIADGAGDIVGSLLEAESLYRVDNMRTRLVARRFQDFGLTYMWRRNSFNYAYMHEVDKDKQISLGRKYEQITYLIGFRHGDAGKTMGLASYGRTLVEPFGHFDNLWFSLRFRDLLQELEEVRISYGLPHHKFVSSMRADIAQTGQIFVESAVTNLLTNLRPQLQGENLCLGGGLFLNCHLNSRILRECGWRRVHIFPAAGDDGQAVGAAFYAYNQFHGEAASSPAPLPFLGLQYGSPVIKEALEHFGVPYEQLDDGELARRVAELLAQDKIVAILRGRSELGPRALCHRSILADPRHIETRNRLNEIVKFREPFRPFGPVVTNEDQLKYFDLPQESPYMLLTAPVRQEFRSELRAITHIDGSARVQSISQDKDAFIHRLLQQFEGLTRFPILLNTSFNLADEPIVESPYDALSTFIRSPIDVLVLENYLVSKPTQRTGSK
jgi:carbamoyltransferase